MGGRLIDMTHKNNLGLNEHSERKSVHSLESDAIRRCRGLLVHVHL